MRTEYSKKLDLAYIYLKEIGQGEIARTVSPIDAINVDLDLEGKIIGIEIFEASKHVPREFLSQADVVD